MSNPPELPSSGRRKEDVSPAIITDPQGEAERGARQMMDTLESVGVKTDRTDYTYLHAEMLEGFKKLAEEQNSDQKPKTGK